MESLESTKAQKNNNDKEKVDCRQTERVLTVGN
jgi:hypothetical protein